MFRRFARLEGDLGIRLVPLIGHDAVSFGAALIVLPLAGTLAASRRSPFEVLKGF